MKNTIYSTKIEQENDKITVFNTKIAFQKINFSSLFKPYWFNVVKGLFLLLGTNGAALFLPRQINKVVSMVDEQFAVSAIMRFASLIVLVAVFGACMRVYSRMVLFDIGRKIEKDLRKMLFSHLLFMSPSFYRERSVGDLMSHLTSDINNIRLCTGFLVLNTLNMLIVFIGTIPILFSIDISTAVVAMLPFILVVLGTTFFSRQMFERTKEYQATLGKLTTHVQQNLNALSVMRLFQQEAKERTFFEKVNNRVYQSSMRQALIRICMPPIMRALTGLGIALTIYFGGTAVLNNTMTLGDYVEFNTRLMQLSWPAMSIGFIISIYNRGKASLIRINDLLSVRPEICDGSHDAQLKGEIEVNNVSVVINKQQLVRAVDFKVAPNTTVAIVGRTGAGKSLLAQALIRQIAYSEGKVFYDGCELRQLKLNTLFSQVCLVSSEPFLFSMSLRSNMCFARSNVSEDELQRAIQLVSLSQDIQQLPHGLETMVGEKGITLSGGQRQRVALARAIIQRPKVLILDDCLSAIDVENQQTIMHYLRTQAGISTIIIITHRLSSISYADEILVMDKGSIVEQGTHGSLLTQKGSYAALWNIEQIERGL